MVPPRKTDRKSTRLNSSHITISYAVFCLKKKNNAGADVTQDLHDITTGTYIANEIDAMGCCALPLQIDVIDLEQLSPIVFFFFFNDTATTEIYTLSLHDALPICVDFIILLRLGETLFGKDGRDRRRSEEHTSELQSHHDLVCRLLLAKKKEQRIFPGYDDLTTITEKDVHRGLCR